MKKNTSIGVDRAASAFVLIMRTVMSYAVKSVVLMGLVFSAGSCSSSDDEDDENLVFGNGKIKGHEYVDLGLSVKWATCNVGASSPEDYGDYFAWGEISPKSSYTKGNNATYGKTMGDISGDSRYDAARSNWGGTWRIPTRSELSELKNRCTWTWTTMNGKKGYKVTGPNGNSIFLPAAGYRGETSLNRGGSNGSYWSSSPYESGTNDAYSLYFDSSYFYLYYNYRSYGRSVRPVTE